ncbi:MAG: energy transducer TonB [Bacteroidetes bacterium]|nr:MAG: energy transducer TonB [Bacteroidota bacterium]REK07598.1 MAG: energy transducer TonB [Bacteroidota bacterium]REK47790.1 MAG: energy transducer TonB [Bacteroidota bacterium]
MKSKKDRKPESFITQPKFPGGNKAMDQFVSSNLRYPEEAIENKVEGTVAVDFDIDVFGNVIEAKIKHGIGYGCDEEALRLVKLLKFEKKKYQGMRVVFHRSINIHFRLHSASVKPVQGNQIQYNFIPAKPDITGKDKESTKSTTYTFNINLGN